MPRMHVLPMISGVTDLPQMALLTRDQAGRSRHTSRTRCAFRSAGRPHSTTSRAVVSQGRASTPKRSDSARIAARSAAGLPSVMKANCSRPRGGWSSGCGRACTSSTAAARSACRTQWWSLACFQWWSCGGFPVVAQGRVVPARCGSTYCFRTGGRVTLSSVPPQSGCLKPLACSVLSR